MTLIKENKEETKDKKDPTNKETNSLQTEECQCEETFNKMCVKCGRVREGRHLNGEEWHKSYLLLDDKLQYGITLALKKEKELKRNLIKEKKLILILDLDNTVLHSTTVNRCVHGSKFKGRLYKGIDLFQIPMSEQYGIYTHTKFRAFMKQFIETVTKNFKIYIYTMGNRKYASSIVEFINRSCEGEKIPETKIISRDDGHMHTEGKIYKTLRQLSPTDQSFYMILDDRPDVWPESSDNLLQVYPYVYFPSQKEEQYLCMYPDYYKWFTQSDDDPFLLYYADYLKRLHDEYFKEVEELKDDHEVDIRKIHSRFFSTLFKGINCVYVNLSRGDKESDQTQTYEWKNTERRGMNNMHEYESGVTNLVVTTDRLKHSDVLDQAIKDKCKIVSVLWIHLSMHLNTLLPYELFTPKEHKSNGFSSESCNVNNEEIYQKEIISSIIGIDNNKVVESIPNPEEAMKERFKQTRHDEYINLIKKLISLHFEANYENGKEEYEKYQEEKLKALEEYK